MSGADKYYGDEALGYDADRSRKPRWDLEQSAVDDFVHHGPVLDVPLGTGRYVGIYRAKGLEVVGVDISRDMIAIALGKFPDLDARLGNVLSLPFGDKEFGTAVCTRLLDWMSPEDMPRAVAALKRVAKHVVLTVRHGSSGVYDENYTHELAKFYEAIDGLFIAERRITEETRFGTEEIMLLRPAVWGDVLNQFRYRDEPCDVPWSELDRVASEWVGEIELTQANTAVRAEYWTNDELFSIIEYMGSKYDSYARRLPARRYVSNFWPPRMHGLPVTVLKARGQTLVLDGVRRVNHWKDRPGRYPVLALSTDA